MKLLIILFLIIKSVVHSDKTLKHCDTNKVGIDLNGKFLCNYKNHPNAFIELKVCNKYLFTTKCKDWVKVHPSLDGSFNITELSGDTSGSFYFTVVFDFLITCKGLKDNGKMCSVKSSFELNKDCLYCDGEPKSKCNYEGINIKDKYFKNDITCGNNN
uniref:Uncharacterized protein n=1 Tax=Parastrongyloides trichosuri TaxID=131310 RepID=A0A0N5A6B9_PARTI